MPASKVQEADKGQGQTQGSMPNKSAAECVCVCVPPTQHAPCAYVTDCARAIAKVLCASLTHAAQKDANHSCGCASGK